MAQIRLSTDERINVRETYDEVVRRIQHPECIETGFVRLTDIVSIISFKGGEQVTEQRDEPVFINRQHILMIY
jgi:hypothetical protein